MKKNTYNFANTGTIYSACRMAQENKMVVLIEGGSGLGKTYGFNFYARTNPQVLIDEAEIGDRAEAPWRRILLQLNRYDRKRYVGCIEFMNKQIIAKLKAQRDPTLVILDEGNFLCYSMLRHLRALVDHTKGCAGFVISGPENFINEVKLLIEEGAIGMKGLDTRIDLYVKLSRPTNKEKRIVCEKEGITDLSKVRQICSRVDNFRDLFREISFHHKGIEGRKTWEWGTDIGDVIKLPRLIEKQ